MGVSSGGREHQESNRAMVIRSINSSDREWVTTLLTNRWGSPLIVHRSDTHLADKLPGLIAELGNERVGLITYAIKNQMCEIVTLDSLLEGQGVGSSLLEALVQKAEALACRRLWLITTNDNWKAQAFYRKRGFQLVIVDYGAVADARKRKPSIPKIGMDGVPIDHELRMERPLQ